MSTSLAAVKSKIKVVNGRLVVSSYDVAKCFGKEHFNVVRDVESLEIPQKWRLFNFEGSQIKLKTPTGGERKIKGYDMTRDGFAILAMGFTGKKAMKFKIDFIEAFNRMERELRARATEAAESSPRLSGLSFPVRSLRWDYEEGSRAILVLPTRLADIRNTPLDRMIDAASSAGADVSGCRVQLSAMASALGRIIEVAIDRSARLDPTMPLRIIPA